EKLEADGAYMGWHAVQDPARRGDEAVAALLLYARQTREEFICDILAQASLAKGMTLDDQSLSPQHLLAGSALTVGPPQLEDGLIDLMDLAQVMVDAGHLQPVTLRIYHAPPG